MIAMLRGSVAHIVDEKHIVLLTPSGVGYEVRVPRFCGFLVGFEESLDVYEHAVKDGIPKMYGLRLRLDMDVFRRLLTADGVGPETAMAVFDAPGGCAAAQAADVAGLLKIKGVGKKTAEKIAEVMRG